MANIFGAKKIGSAITSFFVKLIDSKVPTTSRYISEKQKDEVRKLLQPGDILLRTNNEFPGWQIMEKIFFKSNWTHESLYMGNNKVAEANNGKTFQAQSSLEKYLDAYHITLVRPHYKTEEDKQSAIQYMLNADGRPYDDKLDTNDESALYCSEAVYHAFRKMPHPIKLTPKKAFTGQAIVSPDEVLHRPDFSILWSSKSNFWKNQLSHWPIGAGALIGAGSATTLGTTLLQTGRPIAMAVGGVIAGTALAWGIMHLIYPSLDSQKTQKNYP